MSVISMCLSSSCKILGYIKCVKYLYPWVSGQVVKGEGDGVGRGVDSGKEHV